jgi:hypothetical protein
MASYIAVILLMVLSVAAGVVIYSYSMGYLGNIGTPTQTQTSLSLDSASLNANITSPSVTLTAYIRNLGNSAFVPDSVYIDGVKIARLGSGTLGWSFWPSELNQSQVGKLTIPQDSVLDGSSNSGEVVVTFNNNITYKIEIIGQDNSRLSFEFHASTRVTAENVLVNSDFESGLDPWIIDWGNMGRTSAYTSNGFQHDGSSGTRVITDTYIDMLPNPDEEIYSRVYQEFSAQIPISSIPLTDGTLQLWLENFGPALDGYNNAEIRIVTDSGTLSYIFGGTRADPKTVYISLGELPESSTWKQVGRNLYNDLVNSGFSTTDSITRIELRSNGYYDTAKNLRYGQVIGWDDVKLYVKS